MRLLTKRVKTIQSDKLIDFYLKLSNLIWSTGLIPVEWTHSEVLADASPYPPPSVTYNMWSHCLDVVKHKMCVMSYRDCDTWSSCIVSCIALSLIIWVPSWNLWLWKIRPFWLYVCWNLWLWKIRPFWLYVSEFNKTDISRVLIYD